MGLDVHHCPVAEARRDACAESGGVDSESSVETTLALTFIKCQRKTRLLERRLTPLRRAPHHQNGPAPPWP
ncbi:hypothetical protein EMIT0P253_20227 [Pseudomonas sp. IT-P253]